MENMVCKQAEKWNDDCRGAMGCNCDMSARRSVSAMASGTQVGQTLVLRNWEERVMEAILMACWKLRNLHKKNQSMIPRNTVQ